MLLVLMCYYVFGFLEHLCIGIIHIILCYHPTILSTFSIYKLPLLLFAEQLSASLATNIIT